MRVTRIFVDQAIATGQSLELNDKAAHYLSQVLRLQPGMSVVLFNGRGGEYTGQVQISNKRRVVVDVSDFDGRDVESPVQVVLAQGISRGERMDYTLQKAVELGVSAIVPLVTERCVVRFDEERAEKRLAHWRGIITSACEQCGRNVVPELQPVATLSHWLTQVQADRCVVLDHQARQSLAGLDGEPGQSVVLLVGPEGGLSDVELGLAREFGFLPVHMGPRILRTETAAMVALSIIQARWGDLR